MATETIQATDHKLYVAGEWMETGEWSEVKAPYDGTVDRPGAQGRRGARREGRRGRRARLLTPAASLRTSAPRCSTAPPNWSPSARTT